VKVRASCWIGLVRSRKRCVRGEASRCVDDVRGAPAADGDLAAIARSIAAEVAPNQALLVEHHLPPIS
jgi:hypothetical protein